MATMDDALQGTCRACTHVNPASSAFCNACGSRLQQQPASASASPKGPHSYFRAPLVPEDVRDALGPLRWPMPPTTPNESESDGTTTGCELGEFADTDRELSRLRALRTGSGAHAAVEAQFERMTIPTLVLRAPAPGESPTAGELPARDQVQNFAQSSLPQASPHRRYRNDSGRNTVTKTISWATLIGLLAIGGAMVADRGRQASAQADDRSAAGQRLSGDGTTAGVAELAPAEQAREIRYSASARPETPHDKPFGESPAAASVPQGGPSDDHRRRNSVGDNASEPLEPYVGLVPPTSSNADSLPPSGKSLAESSSPRSSASGGMPANAAIATQQKRQLRTPRDESPRQEPKECSMQQHVLGLCTNTP